MAKYLLKSSLIPTLKARGVVSGDDMMTMKIPHRVKGQKEQMFEITFDVNEALETDNRIAMTVIEQKRSPRVQVDGGWWLGDPTIQWFDKLADGDPTTSNVVHTDGDEILTMHERKLVHFYMKATGATKPVSWKKTDAAAIHADAAAYFAD